jgi:ribosomal protein L16 Arg81 hydroxylase
MASRESGISFGRRRWIAEMRMHGCTEQQIVMSLCPLGVTEDEIKAEMQVQDKDPCFEAGERIGRQLRKVEAVFNACSFLRDLSPANRAVRRRSGVSSAEFLQLYYSTNTPVVLGDIMGGWPALSVWTPARLRDRLGSALVEVMQDRSGSSAREMDGATQRVTVPFCELIDAVEHDRPDRELYLVGNNHFFETEAAEPLWEDFSIDDRFLDRSKARGCVCLWLGPGMTVTPLHRDTSNILFCQVYGRKRFTLISPFDSHRLYSAVGVFAAVDCECPDLDRFPRFRGVHQEHLVLNPGDALFIPVGWWHRVEALDTSVSLSFTNFLFPNKFS